MIGASQPRRQSLQQDGVKSHELSVPELGHLERNVEIEGQLRIARVDPEPIVLTGFLCFPNHTVTLDDTGLYPLYVKCFLQQGHVVDDRTGQVPELELEGQASDVVVHTPAS